MRTRIIYNEKLSAIDLAQDINTEYLEVLGCYAPNLKFKPVSMYKVNLEYATDIFLDMGYGNLNKLNLNNLSGINIIISHNHIDHNLGLLELLIYLKIHKVKLDNRINVYMPFKSNGLNICKLLKKQKTLFKIYEINENKKVEIGGRIISFCKTEHKGESYAIKLFNKKDRSFFVYTSDLAKVTISLIRFCKKADTIIIDGGRPLKNKFSLGNYHGHTEKILKDIICAKPAKIIITHMKEYADENLFKSVYPEKNKIPIEIAKLSKKYKL
ncbi:MAG: MBL fold metallo-hydrolase [Clostridia bacterium]